MRLVSLLAVLASPAIATLAMAEVDQGPPNASFAPAFPAQTRAPALPVTAVSASLFAGGLENPWGIATLPDGNYLVTERPGRLRPVSATGEVGAPINGLPEVETRQQGGLLDVAISPEFATDRRVFWTYATDSWRGRATAAATGILSADATRMTDVEVIFRQSQAIRGSGVHYGARIVPDGAGHVFITTGDRGMNDDAALLMDPGEDLGKVMRLIADGTEPADNPLAGIADAGDVWTLGHRNVQGAALDGDGTLWTVEHGPRGGDELNRLEPGANHGWPVVSYGIDYGGDPVGGGLSNDPGFVEPVYYWDPVIAPGGMAFYAGAMFPDWQGDVLIASLNPGGLVRLRMADNRVAGEERLLPDLGRVRDVEVLADGSILLLTDSGDGGIWRVTPGN